jgi:hypothetical protein
MNIMKRTAGPLSGILIFLIAQVILIIGSPEQPANPVRANELVQARDLPDSPWIENPDENVPAIAKSHSLTFNFRPEYPGNPAMDPRFRFTLAELPDPLYIDRPPPPVCA